MMSSPGLMHAALPGACAWSGPRQLTVGDDAVPCVGKGGARAPGDRLPLVLIADGCSVSPIYPSVCPYETRTEDAVCGSRRTSFSRPRWEVILSKVPAKEELASNTLTDAGISYGPTVITRACLVWEAEQEVMTGQAMVVIHARRGGAWAGERSSMLIRPRWRLLSGAHGLHWYPWRCSEDCRGIFKTCSLRRGLPLRVCFAVMDWPQIVSVPGGCAERRPRRLAGSVRAARGPGSPGQRCVTAPKMEVEGCQGVCA
jgi:hypothetical protein